MSRFAGNWKSGRYPAFKQKPCLADLSISLGLPPGNNDDEPAFTEALLTIVAACNKAGVIAGIHSTGALTPLRRHQGFRMITVTSDLLAMRTRLVSELQEARSVTVGNSPAGGAMY